MKTLRKVPVHPDVYDRLRALAAETLRAAEFRLPDDTTVYRPDASGHYAGVWLRDFCYMVEGLGDLLDLALILPVADLFLRAQLRDGSLPTRIAADGVPEYREGPREAPIGAGPPTDNPQFMAKLLCAYAALTGDWQALLDRLPAVERAFDSLPTDRDGMIHIDANVPRSGYGFTDCVAKTGREFFSNLLLAEAACEVAETCRRFEQHDEAFAWYERSTKLGDWCGQFYVPGWRMFAAAKGDCRQIDVWGSAYACVTHAATGSQRDAVAGFLLDHYDACIWHGHVRHLPAGEYWERLLTPVAPDHYQNGGFWAVPSGWVAQTIATLDAGRAAALIADVVSEFETHGVHEWVHPDNGRHVSGYVASLACVLASLRPMSRKNLAR
jgi:hypothetical protein